MSINIEVVLFVHAGSVLKGVQSHPWMLVKTLQNLTYIKSSIRFEQVVPFFVAFTGVLKGSM